ncbi:MAG: GAF domain-containing protein, partial [Desulfobacterales bacterium]
MTKEKDYFRTFCKVSKAFGTTLSSEKLLDLIVQSAIDTMDGKAACLFLAEEQKDIFVPVAQKGLSDNYLHQKPLKARRLVKAIVKEGHLQFRDATTDPRLEHHDAKKAEG